MASGLAMASLTAETEGTTVWDVSQEALATRAKHAESTRSDPCYLYVCGA